MPIDPYLIYFEKIDVGGEGKGKIKSLNSRNAKALVRFVKHNLWSVLPKH